MVRAELELKVELTNAHFIAVPVQELEAWIIADETAITKTIPSLAIKPVAWPETIPSPKEHLVRESTKRPLPTFVHVPSIFNPKVAKNITPEIVERKCPSFKELVDFIKSDIVL